MAEKVRTPRTTSPPSPSFSLMHCIKDTELLYAQYRHAPFSRAEIATTLQLSATSGPFRQRLASLKMYNLINPTSNTQLTISETFERLHFADNNSTEYKKAAHDAITNSSTFKEILRHLSNQLPNPEILARKLEADMGFNHNTATRTAKILTSSLADADLIDSKGNITPIRDEYNQPVDPEPAKTLSAPIPQPSQESRTLRTEIPLESGQIITIEYPSKISQTDTEKITKVLAALAD